MSKDLAEEYIKNKLYITQDGIEDVHDSLSNVKDVMIEFANLCVEKSLEENKYKKAYDILMDFFGLIPDEEKPTVHEKLTKLGL
jgi:hypothetical protein